MGIFQRIGMLIRSNLNALISRAEDPEKMLEQALLDMREQMISARTQVAQAIADLRRLEKQLEAEAAQAQAWEKKAMLAVRAGDDALARQALIRRDEHLRLAAEWQEQVDKQATAVDHLKSSLRKLNDKVEEARRKKAILIARKKRAEAQKQITAALHGLNDVAAFDVIDRMSQRVDQLEAEADAQAELARELSGDTLAERFKALEHTVGVDDALAQLKARMGIGYERPAPRALGHEPLPRFEPQPRRTEEVEEPVPVGPGFRRGTR